MKRHFLALLLVACLWPVVSSAAGLQRILLTDNTILIGKVLELKQGVYSIETETLGTVKINADKISEISVIDRQAVDGGQSAGDSSSNPSPAIAIIDGSRKTASSAGDTSTADVVRQSVPSGSDDLSRQQQEVNSRVQSMAMDGDFLDSMMNIGNSEAMNDIMQDPEIMDAISRNDYDFLMNNEKMKSLMDSQEIKELLGDVQP